MALLAANPKPTDAQIVEGLNGHLCRCSGYQRIVAAVHHAAAASAGRTGREDRWRKCDGQPQGVLGGRRRGPPDRLATAPSPGPEGRRRGRPLEARLHIGEDGFITVLSGKIEEGQGALTELAMAAAEELRIPLERVRMVMADTDRDAQRRDHRRQRHHAPHGAGWCERPRRRRASCCWPPASRQLGVDAARLEVRDGAVASGGKTYTYADLARSPELATAYKDALPQGTTVTAAKDWQVLGKPQVRLDGRDIVTGAHRYPRDIVRPGMLYGRVLRPPAYGATLAGVDLSAARKMPGVTAVRDGDFVGCAAPTSFAARKALEAISAGAQWNAAEQPSSDNLFEYLKQHAKPQGRNQPQVRGSVETGLAGAKRRLKASYQVAYAQHAPMEPRAAVAEWQDGRLTVWTGTSNPFSVRQQLAEAFKVPADRVRVIVPHFGGGFGGKHTAEAAVEAARLAREAGRPVAMQWTRAEEFMWAYFRPAALIEVEAGLDAANSISAWDFTNYNSGGFGPGHALPHSQHARAVYGIRFAAAPKFVPMPGGHGQ